ncbi:hypothetical protein VP01_91g2 [Puccinia sorghi]|uniref:Uncharacterized protein n=1 Tax=Puccinia sorghi TaxID=27349 RepID=A0A0L6U9F4_9BASI|nr:hypothetical protein VP01_91g2 [Puccinia sorghi]
MLSHPNKCKRKGRRMAKTTQRGIDQIRKTKKSQIVRGLNSSLLVDKEIKRKGKKRLRYNDTPQTSWIGSLNHSPATYLPPVDSIQRRLTLHPTPLLVCVESLLDLVDFCLTNIIKTHQAELKRLSSISQIWPAKERAHPGDNQSFNPIYNSPLICRFPLLSVPTTYYTIQLNWDVSRNQSNLGLNLLIQSMNTQSSAAQTNKDKFNQVRAYCKGCFEAPRYDAFLPFYSSKWNENSSCSSIVTFNSVKNLEFNLKRDFERILTTNSTDSAYYLTLSQEPSNLRMRINHFYDLVPWVFELIINLSCLLHNPQTKFLYVFSPAGLLTLFNSVILHLFGYLYLNKRDTPLLAKENKYWVQIQDMSGLYRIEPRVSLSSFSEKLWCQWNMTRPCGVKLGSQSYLYRHFESRKSVSYGKRDFSCIPNSCAIRDERNLNAGVFMTATVIQSTRLYEQLTPSTDALPDHSLSQQKSFFFFKKKKKGFNPSTPPLLPLNKLGRDGRQDQQRPLVVFTSAFNTTVYVLPSLTGLSIEQDDCPLPSEPDCYRTGYLGPQVPDYALSSTLFLRILLPSLSHLSTHRTLSCKLPDTSTSSYFLRIPFYSQSHWYHFCATVVLIFIFIFFFFRLASSIELTGFHRITP